MYLPIVPKQLKMAPILDNETIMMHLTDPTNASIVLLMTMIVLIIGLGSIYIYCCMCTMRGELDLVTDEETRRPFNVVYFKNPFKRRDKNNVELTELR